MERLECLQNLIMQLENKLKCKKGNNMVKIPIWLIEETINFMKWMEDKLLK